MMNGKKVQNFISYQTKQTIYLNQNLPQLIVHQETIQTDSLKVYYNLELLTKRSQKQKNKNISKNSSKQKKNTLNQLNNLKYELKKQKQNLDKNYQHQRLKFNNFVKSNKNLKSHYQFQRSLSHGKQYQHQNDQHQISTKRQKKIKKQYCFQKIENNDKSKSKSKNKLNKKTKSMIRLTKYDDKNIMNNQDSSKRLIRKSLSPNRNYSEGLKKTNNPTTNPTTNNNSNQYIKTTKFTIDSKDQQNIKKEKKYFEQKKQKEKLKIKQKSSKTNLMELLNNNHGNLVKNSYTSRKKDQQKEIKNFIKDQTKKSSKIKQFKEKQNDKKNKKKDSPQRKISFNKNKSKEKFKNTNIQMFKKTKQPLKKRKSLGKTKIHFDSANQEFLMRDTSQSPQTIMLDKYVSNRDSLNKKNKTDRDSLNRKSLNKNQSKDKLKKQIILSNKNIQKLRNQAAIKIQKVYKGYITRKWLNEYLKIINAVVKIQKNWRGYKCRQKIYEIKKQKIHQIKNKIQKQKQNSFTKSKIQDSLQIQNIQKWKGILLEVIGQQSVNQNLKSKIKFFLQTQQTNGRSSLLSKKSRNSEQKLKEQILSQKRYFQKQFHKRQSPKYKQEYTIQPLMPVSPSFDLKTNKEKLFSPIRRNKIVSNHNDQQMTFSPKLQKKKIKEQQKIRSPQHIVCDLYQIQQFQKKRLVQNAELKKYQLNNLKKNSLISPKTFKLKEKQINENLNKKIKEFQQNINGVLSSVKQSEMNLSSSNLMKEYSLEVYEPIISQNSYLKQEQGLPSQQIISKPLQRYPNQGFSLIQDDQNKDKEILFDMQADHIKQQKNELTYYQKFQTFNINALSSQKSQEADQILKNSSKKKKIDKIDPSYNFIDDYLLTLIQFIRNKGQSMIQVVRGIKVFKNLSPYVVLRNLSTVKQEGQNSQDDDAFCLPLYKYLEDDNQIINKEIVKQFNKYFFNNNLNSNNHKSFYSPQIQRQQSPLLLSPNQKYQQRNQQIQIGQCLKHYLKLLIDSFNQALNLKRPSHYMFTSYAIQSYNSKHIVSREEYDIQQEYDMYCASSMQQIYLWYNIRYGQQLNLNKDEQNQINQKEKQQQQQQQIKPQLNQNIALENQIVFFNKKAFQKMIKMQVSKPWEEYYQTIEVIAKLSQAVFQDLIIRQSFTILNIQGKFMEEMQLLQ